MSQHPIILQKLYVIILLLLCCCITLSRLYSQTTYAVEWKIVLQIQCWANQMVVIGDQDPGSYCTITLPAEAPECTYARVLLFTLCTMFILSTWTYLIIAAVKMGHKPIQTDTFTISAFFKNGSPILLLLPLLPQFWHLRWFVIDPFTGVSVGFLSSKCSCPVNPGRQTFAHLSNTFLSILFVIQATFL